MSEQDKGFGIYFEKVRGLRYGENGWQKPATFYRNARLEDSDHLAIHHFEVLAGDVANSVPSTRMRLSPSKALPVPSSN